MIRTRIVGVEGEHTDHLTTATTALTLPTFLYLQKFQRKNYCKILNRSSLDLMSFRV